MKIALKRMSADDPIRLSILKSHFNRLAGQLNYRSHPLSKKRQQALAKQLKEVEAEIEEYTLNSMSYYKVKVRHKTIPDRESWFYFTGLPQEELEMLIDICLKYHPVFYPLPETLLEIRKEEYLASYQEIIFKNT